MHERIRGAIRPVAMRVPPVRRLVAQRDRLVARAERAREERDVARRELAKVRAELSQLRTGRGGAPGELERVRGELEQLRASFGQFPPGHFYSPVPDLDEVRREEERIWAVPAELPGIDLRADDQLGLLPVFHGYYLEQPFGKEPRDGLRYGFENRFFSYGDGVALYAQLRHLRPRRLVEVGSGWSSALTLDVVDRFLDGGVHLTFVEPYPERLHSLVRPEDASRVDILEQPLHRVDPSVFAELEPGDVLFVDSTHVSRVGSDVNQLLLEIFPSLPAGVHVHVHDVFYPFEYPQSWVYGGRAWNEAYLLRALLTDNARLRITWFNDYLGRFHRNRVAEAMPLWARNSGGSIWLETR